MAFYGVFGEILKNILINMLKTLYFSASSQKVQKVKGENVDFFTFKGLLSLYISEYFGYNIQKVK